MGYKAKKDLKDNDIKQLLNKLGWTDVSSTVNSGLYNFQNEEGEIVTFYDMQSTYRTLLLELALRGQA
jgi:hypothetical protein